MWQKYYQIYSYHFFQIQKIWEISNQLYSTWNGFRSSPCKTLFPALTRNRSWLRDLFLLLWSYLGFCLVIVTLDRFSWMVWMRRIWETKLERNVDYRKTEREKKKVRDSETEGRDWKIFIIRKCSMVVLLNVKIVPLNMRENKTIRECDKNAVTCDVGTAQCEDSTIKCEKKIRELLNVTKVQLHVMLVLLNMRMVP